MRGCKANTKIQTDSPRNKQVLIPAIKICILNSKAHEIDRKKFKTILDSIREDSLKRTSELILYWMFPMGLKPKELLFFFGLKDSLATCDFFKKPLFNWK